MVRVCLALIFYRKFACPPRSGGLNKNCGSGLQAKPRLRRLLWKARHYPLAGFLFSGLLNRNMIYLLFILSAIGVVAMLDVAIFRGRIGTSLSSWIYRPGSTG